MKREELKQDKAAAKQPVQPIHRKSNLSKPQKKHFYDLLMRARNEFMEQVKFHTDEALTSQKDSAGERAGMATHMADLGSDNSRHDLELGLLSEEVDVVEMIEDSFQRLQDDEYGICVDCGCDIALERLEAKPYARFCTKCKARHEAREDSSHRRSR
jgi:DnaK suppressor protein